VYEAAADRLEAVLARQRAEGAASPWTLARDYGITTEEVFRRMDNLYRRGRVKYWDTRAGAAQAFAFGGDAVRCFRATIEQERAAAVRDILERL
jgi:hypothetical protein